VKGIVLNDGMSGKARSIMKQLRLTVTPREQYGERYRDYSVIAIKSGSLWEVSFEPLLPEKFSGYATRRYGTPEKAIAVGKEAIDAALR
jgi:hypothetical protein